MMLRVLAACVGFAVLAVPLAAAEPAAEPGHEVPYRLTDTKHVLIRVKLNGKGPFNLICDTGAPAVFVTKAVAKQAGAKIDEKGWANFDSFQLEGGLAVENGRGRVEDLFQLEGMNGMGLAGVELHGVIGYNVLAKYRITYDFTKDKLLWQPLKGFEPPPLGPGRKGGGGQGGLEVVGTLMKTMAMLMGVKVNFAVLPRGFTGVVVVESDGKVEVRSVLAGTPAEKAGLKAGDRIVRVRTTAVDDVGALHKALEKAGVGDGITLEIEREGKPVKLVLTLGKGL